MTGPTMDDMAASQQLMEEAARAQHAGGGNSISVSLPSTPDSDPMSSQQTLLSSMLSFVVKRPQGNKKALRSEPASPPISTQSAPSTPRRVEVPDSQLAPAPSRSGYSPLMPTAPSSFAIPASVQETPAYQKGKKRLHAEVDTSNILPEQHASNTQEETATGAAETSLASAPTNKRRRGKKSYATPPSTETGSERTAATSDQDTSTMLSVADVGEGVATTTPRSGKRRNLARKNTGERLLSDAVDGDNVAVGDELVIGRLPRVKRLRNPKPSRTTKHPATQQSDPEALDEAPEMEPTNSDANQTPFGTESAEAERPDAINNPLVLKKRRRTGKQPDENVPTSQLCLDAMQNDADPIDDEVSNVSPSKSTPNQKRKRKHKAPLSSPPRRPYARKNRVDTSKAERELNTFRDLRLDSELPSSGPFSEDENELLRRAVRDYCQRRGLDTEGLVDIILWTDPSCNPTNPRMRKDWTHEDVENAEESKEFWDEIMNSQPSLQRTREIVKRHVQARFSTYKSGAWTEDEDKQLKQLMEEYPKNWQVISLAMNRSGHDCLNRWKDYVQFGDRRNNGPWTAKEEGLLLSALRTVIQQDEDQRDAAKLPSLAEYVSGNIKWEDVFELMGHIRNRPQCITKWTAMKEKGNAAAAIRPVYKRGRTPDPTRPADPTPKKMKAPRKNNAHTGSGNDDEASIPKRRGRPRKSRTGGEDTPKTTKAWRQSKIYREVAAHDKGDEVDVPDTPRIGNAGTPTSRKSKRVSANAPHDEVNEDENLDIFQNGNVATPASRQSRSILHTPTADVAQMRWGDKFNLLEAIACDDSIVNEEDVDWRKISSSMKTNCTWSVRVLQAALKELLKLVEDQATFGDTIMALLMHVGEQRNHDELWECYDPYNVDPLGEGDDTGAKASQSAKTRKRQSAHGKSPVSRSGMAKRTQRGSLTAMKSAPFVTDSDDAENNHGGL
jgi:hypothetical protein